MASKLGKAIGGGAAVLGAGLALSTCNPVVTGVAEMLAGGQPEMPARREDVQRASVDLGLGIDSTKSKVAKQLGPVVLPATNEALQSGLFADGDDVRLCKVGGPGTGDTTCETFEMNSQLGALTSRVGSITDDGDYTHLKAALRELVSGLQAPCSAALWTDAINEETDDSRVNTHGCDLDLLIPDASYRSAANELCAAVEGDCDVVLAQTGSDVEAALSGVFEELQRAAQAEADRINAEIEAEYQRALADYEGDKASLHEKAQKLKEKARITLLSITGFLSAVMATLILYVTKPKCAGVVYIRVPKGRGFKIIVMPLERFNSSEVNLAKEGAKSGMNLPDLTFKASRGGAMSCGGMQLNGVVEIADGVVYSREPLSKRDPRYRALKDELTGQE